MKKFISILLVVIVILTILFVYERLFVRSQFGPTTMLAVIMLLSFILALIVTLFSYGTRFHEVVTRGWMMFISISITFVAVDLIAGWLLIKPLSAEHVPDKYLHHKLVPNTNARFEQVEFSYVQRVNNLGIRGKDRTLEKPSQHYRILMLGDSFTMGKGVEDDQTFSALLENSLNLKKTCTSKTFEVLNAGVDSYAPILSYIQLKKYLAPMRPDVIVLNLDPNDLIQEDVYRKIANYNDKGEVIGVPGPISRKVAISQRIRGWIDQHLYFTRLLLYYTNTFFEHADFSVEDLVSRASYNVIPYTIAEDKINRDEQWKQLFATLIKIKSFSDERAIPFILTHYPWGHLVNDREFNPGRYQYIPEGSTPSDKYLATLLQLAEESGIELVNLFPAFRAYKGEKLLYYKHDGHFTSEGHKIMATELEQYLTAKLSTTWCQ